MFSLWIIICHLVFSAVTLLLIISSPLLSLFSLHLLSLVAFDDTRSCSPLPLFHNYLHILHCCPCLCRVFLCQIHFQVLFTLRKFSTTAQFLTQSYPHNTKHHSLTWAWATRKQSVLTSYVKNTIRNRPYRLNFQNVHSRESCKLKCKDFMEHLPEV